MPAEGTGEPSSLPALVTAQGGGEGMRERRCDSPWRTGSRHGKRGSPSSKSTQRQAIHLMGWFFSRFLVARQLEGFFK